MEDDDKFKNLSDSLIAKLKPYYDLYNWCRMKMAELLAEEIKKQEEENEEGVKHDTVEG